jgi:hypothetical protein
MTRLKVADLTSGVGALVLGVGLGALLSRWFAPAAGAITLAGWVMHAFGMWDKHRLESGADAEASRWVTALYWLCWFLLAVVLAALLLGSL